MSRQPPTITFDQAPRRKLSETVAEQILDGVRDQQPGTRLPPERELSTSLGVGRSTVREALHGLATIGVIEIRHGQGVFVAEEASLPIHARYNDDDGEVTDLRILLEARPVVEVALAEMAAERADDAQLKEIGELLDTHRRDIEAGNAPKIPGSQFHLLIAQAADNPVLASVVKPLFRAMLERGPHLYELQEDYLGWELDEHTRIYDAISDRDAILAARLMKDHVAAMSEVYDRWLATKEQSTGVT